MEQIERTQFKSVEELCAYFREEERKHPIKTFCERVYYSVVRFCEDIYRDTRAFIQRGKRGYADCDVWGFDYYLAEVMVGALTKLKSNKIGYPSELAEKYGDEAELQWNSILDRMIDGFQAVLDYHNAEDYATMKDFKAYEKRLQESLELLKIYYFSLWD